MLLPICALMATTRSSAVRSGSIGPMKGCVEDRHEDGAKPREQGAWASEPSQSCVRVGCEEAMLLICFLLGILRAEEVVAQGEKRAALVRSLDEYGEVVVATAVGDHVHGDLAEGVQDLRLEAHVVPLHIANDADDGHVVLDVDATQALEAVAQVIGERAALDGEGG